MEDADEARSMSMWEESLGVDGGGGSGCELMLDMGMDALL